MRRVMLRGLLRQVRKLPGAVCLGGASGVGVPERVHHGGQPRHGNRAAHPRAQVGPHPLPAGPARRPPHLEGNLLAS
eukprot:9068858-Pyramimonas_sp.AAC.1